MKGKNQSSLKAENTSTILRLVRENAGISRADIVRKTNLAPPTVSRIVSFLIDKKLVKEEMSNGGSVGRKPMSLYFDGSFYHVVSIDFTYSGISMAVINFNGKIFDRISVSIGLDVGSQEAVNLIKTKGEELIGKAKGKKIIGIGVSAPGMIDSEKGVTISTPNLANIRDVPIASELRKHFRLPVMVVNDANAEALAEKYFGKGAGIRDFVVIHTGFGIGSGIVLDHKLYKGNFGVSGEIGHFSINSQGPKCDCGNSGCVELYVGAANILERCSVEAGVSIVSLAEAFVEMERGNKIVEKVVKEAAEKLADVVLGLVNLLAPLRIIISGPFTELGDYFLRPLKQRVEERSFYGFAKNIEFVYSDFGEESGIIAGMTVVLDSFLEHPYSFL